MAEVQNIPEVQARHRFLRDVHAKVVQAPEQEKPKGALVAAETKDRVTRARQATRNRVAMGKEALGDG